jgi:ABC-2 type transport system ATP-binding protein
MTVTMEGAMLDVSIIEALDLRKKYGDFTAVDGLSFAVRKGEIFGLLGPNGAGKTTTINMLIGLARIDSGSLSYDGRVMTRTVKPAQGLFGVVPDESNLYDEMSGFDNLCFCGALYGLPKKTREGRASELLGRFGLEEAGDKRFKAYSKGMKRKLTIAAALIHEPRILFLDEPTTGIDVMSARQIRALLKELNGNGMTILLTTHYIEEAERLCDRVAFIAGGRIVKQDTVAALIAEARGPTTVEIHYEGGRAPAPELIRRIAESFPGVDCAAGPERQLTIRGPRDLDIAPIVGILAAAGLRVQEARLVRPSLEDAFVKFAGIGIDALKKEKEKR